MSEAGILPQSPNAKYGMIPESDCWRQIGQSSRQIRQSPSIVINRSADPCRGSQGEDPVLVRPVSQAWVPSHDQIVETQVRVLRSYSRSWCSILSSWQPSEEKGRERISWQCFAGSQPSIRPQPDVQVILVRTVWLTPTSIATMNPLLVYFRIESRAAITNGNWINPTYLPSTRRAQRIKLPEKNNIMNTKRVILT